MTRPLRRRVFAAIVLAGFAVASVLVWNDGRIDWIDLAANSIAASIGLVVLHFRWRAQERRAMTPRRIEDTFS